MNSGPRNLRLSVDGPSGALEAVVEESVAAETAAPGPRYAVVCHPHPLHGGTMDNKVVTTVARALREAGVPTLRFNFRGVGASDGVFDSGDGETADAAAVASFGASRWPGRHLVIAGFSFGSYVALRLAQLRPASHLITIAPPVSMFGFAELRVPDCPWLVVQGDADEVTDSKAVADWVSGLKPHPQFVVMPGVGHFFHGRLQELRDAVIQSVRSG